MAASLFEEKTEEELWLEYKKKRSPQLRDAFIKQYMPLVKYVAGKISVGMPGSVEFDRRAEIVLQNLDVPCYRFRRAGDIDVLVHIGFTELCSKRGTVRIPVLLQARYEAHEAD